jgi:hypothetical protein
LDFSLSFCPRHPAAWPAAFQITFKNKAGSSLFELLRDVVQQEVSKQHALCLVSHVHFISQMRYHRLYHVPVVWHAIAPASSRLGISSPGIRSPAFFHAAMVT